MEIQFFSALSTSFNIFAITYRVTNFLPKLVHMLLFSMKKNWISFFINSLFFGFARQRPGDRENEWHWRDQYEKKKLPWIWNRCAGAILQSNLCKGKPQWRGQNVLEWELSLVDTMRKFSLDKNRRFKVAKKAGQPGLWATGRKFLIFAVA